MPAVKQTVTLPNGKTIDLFYIGTLAAALGRTTQTVRKWEVGGILPDSCFRDGMGKRLYSQEQIDAIVKIAEECQIRQGAKLSHTAFSSECYKVLGAIKKKYMRKKKESNNNG